MFIIFLIAFSFGLFFTPVLIKYCLKNGYYKEISYRDIHNLKTPNVGGISIFISFFIGIFLLFFYNNSLFFEGFNYSIELLFCAVFIFFIGLYDDIKNINYFFKFIFQFLISIFIVFHCDTNLNSFYGFLQLYDLPIYFLKLFSVVIFVFIINSFNLIDGVDGLASFLGIYINLIFSLIFYLNSCFFEFYICLLLIFCLIMFLFFNKPNAQIFMGDSGSLFIGFFISFFSLKLCNLPIDNSATINPIFILSVLAFPSIDTLRIFMLRIYNGKSPFCADNNHIHHIYLKNNFSHFQICILVLVSSLILALVCYFFRYNANVAFLVTFFLAFFLVIFPLSAYGISVIKKGFCFLKVFN